MDNSKIIFGGPKNKADNNPPLPAKHSSANPEKQWRILIVEDELLVAENIKELLISDGYTIAGICSSGEEAIEFFEKMNPDLILMDIRLSGKLDGIQTAEAIHRDLKRVPILFISAYGEEMIEEISTFDFGPFDLITKPYDKLQISQCIAKLLKQSAPPHIN